MKKRPFFEFPNRQLNNRSHLIWIIILNIRHQFFTHLSLHIFLRQWGNFMLLIQGNEKITVFWIRRTVAERAWLCLCIKRVVWLATCVYSRSVLYPFCHFLPKQKYGYSSLPCDTSNLSGKTSLKDLCEKTCFQQFWNSKDFDTEIQRIRFLNQIKRLSPKISYFSSSI